MHATYNSGFSSIDRYIASAQPNSCKPGIVAIAASLLLVGTGASYPVDAYKQWRPYVQPRVQFTFDTSDNYIVQEAAQEVDVRSVAQHLANIRGVLSPSMSELAKDLGITRQALYKWLSGENQPEDEAKVLFITNLSNIADAFSLAGISDAKMLIKMKAFGGLCLMDLLKQGEDWQQPVQLLINEAKVMSSAVEKANFSASKAIATENWKSSVSIPGTIED